MVLYFFLMMHKIITMTNRRQCPVNHVLWEFLHRDINICCFSKCVSLRALFVLFCFFIFIWSEIQKSDEQKYKHCFVSRFLLEVSVGKLLICHATLCDTRSSSIQAYMSTLLLYQNKSWQLIEIHFFSFRFCPYAVQASLQFLQQLIRLRETQVVFMLSVTAGRRLQASWECVRLGAQLDNQLNKHEQNI